MVAFLIGVLVGGAVSLTVTKKYLPGQPEHNFAKFMLFGFLYSFPISVTILLLVEMISK